MDCKALRCRWLLGTGRQEGKLVSAVVKCARGVFNSNKGSHILVQVVHSAFQLIIFNKEYLYILQLAW